VFQIVNYKKEYNYLFIKNYPAYVEVQVAANQRNMKGMFISIRRLTNSARPATAPPIRDKEGKTITSTEGQIQRWEEFLAEILNTSTSLTEREEPVRLPPDLPISTRLPSKREIVDAITAMKNGKATGPDNIPPVVLKADPYAAADIVLLLFHDIWQKEKLPKEWKEGIIIKVPNKGDLSQCRNWRGVTLLVVISKIFNKIVLERMKGKLEKGLRKEQSGFRHNMSCIDQINNSQFIDQINTLRVIIEQSPNSSNLFACCLWTIRELLTP
jgi:hypothetical protein